jgi:hypothetical protein
MQACALSNDEKKAVAEMLTLRRGLSLFMVWLLLDQYWLSENWDCEGTGKRMTWLGVALGFDSGPGCATSRWRGNRGRELKIHESSLITASKPSMCVSLCR